MEPLPSLSPAYALATAVGLGTVCLAAAPQLLDGMVSLASSSLPVPQLMERLDPRPGAPTASAAEAGQAPLGLLRGPLLEQLAAADRQWLPSSEPLPGGGVRYLYKRRAGEPELSIDEIRGLIQNPPRYDQERQSIVGLLTALQRAGTRLSLTTPHKPGAAAEWDHAARTLRINPSVIERGSVDFAMVLNHEAIHVAQSCKAGNLAARPQPLGLPIRPTPDLNQQLNDPLYGGADAWERSLEREAYAHQGQLGIGAELVRRHCATQEEATA